MPRQIKTEGIAIYAKIAPCAQNCRYCLLGKKDLAGVEFERIAGLIERFIEWRENSGRKDFKIFHWIRHSFECDTAVVGRWVQLWKKLGRTPDLLIGGLAMRSEIEVKKWLADIRDAGIEEIHASFAGVGPVHDYWNGRSGDYEFQMMILRAAAEMGFEISERLLVMKSTLPMLDSLQRVLSEITGRIKRRYLCQLFYMGSAESLEDERLTDGFQQTLSESVKEKFSDDISKWRPESDWIEEIMHEDDSPEPVMLRVDPDAENIGRLEKMSCDEIIEDLEKRTSSAYNAIPGRRDLCEAASEPLNNRLYSIRNDIERKWLDSFLEKNPVSFDRLLTHLSMVQ